MESPRARPYRYPAPLSLSLAADLCCGYCTGASVFLCSQHAIHSPAGLLNSLHIREFTFQQIGLACLGAYAVGLMNIRFFRQRLLRKHSPALARLELMRKVERLAADKYPSPPDMLAK